MPFRGAQPCGCAGIEGDYYTIMGLPVSRTVQTLALFL